MQICEKNQRCRKVRWVKNRTILLKLIFQKSQSHKKWPENIFCQYNDYRTCAILTRSCLEATLDYKPWILGLKKVSYSFFIYLVLWPQIKKDTTQRPPYMLLSPNPRAGAEHLRTPLNVWKYIFLLTMAYMLETSWLITVRKFPWCPVS